MFVRVNIKIIALCSVTLFRLVDRY